MENLKKGKFYDNLTEKFGFHRSAFPGAHGLCLEVDSDSQQGPATQQIRQTVWWTGKI